MRKKLLILTIILAFLLRFIGLGTNPPSLNWDEIAFGYNAYSILQTGKDEYGIKLPTTLRSFDDYKSPFYLYSTVASIFLFGKTEWAVRFPAAFFGTLTIPIFYIFTKKILSIRKRQHTPDDNIWDNRAANIALFATFFLAIVPWHVHFSRVAFEANIALFWEISASWLLLEYVTKPQKKMFLFLATLAYTAGIYSYVSARLFIAMLLMCWSIYFYKTIFKNWKPILIASFLGLLLLSPLIIEMTKGVGLARFNATSIFSRPEIYETNKREAKEDFDRGEGRLSAIVHNYRVPVIKQVIDNYLSHYNFSFLFTKADLQRQKIPGLGLLYIWQLPLILCGGVYLIKNRYYINTYLSLLWLGISLIPAALTWQVPHAIRSELMLPILSLLSGIGLWTLLKKIQQYELRAYTRKAPQTTQQRIIHFNKWIIPKALFILLICILSFSTLRMIINYHTLLPAEYGKYWLYGRKEMVEYVEKNKDKYDTILVSLHLDWAYLWFLWYGNYSSQWYIDNGGTISGGFEETQNKVGKIQFKPFPFTKDNFSAEHTTENTLYVGTPEDFPAKIIPDHEIKDLNNTPVIYIVKS